MLTQMYWPLEKKSERYVTHHDDGTTEDLLLKKESWHEIQNRGTPAACIAFKTMVFGAAEPFPEQDSLRGIKALIKSANRKDTSQLKVSREKNYLDSSTSVCSNQCLAPMRMVTEFLDAVSLTKSKM